MGLTTQPPLRVCNAVVKEAINESNTHYGRFLLRFNEINSHMARLMAMITYIPAPRGYGPFHPPSQWRGTLDLLCIVMVPGTKCQCRGHETLGWSVNERARANS